MAGLFAEVVMKKQIHILIEQNLMLYKEQYEIKLAKTLSQYGHWYKVWKTDKKGKKKLLYQLPSVTHILTAYPTSEQLVKWIAEKGFHESREIRDEAGRKGSHIHSGIMDLLDGQVLNESGYTTEEWVKLKSFTDWYHEYKPEILAVELPVFSKKGKYAGRVDCIARINEQIYLLDWKSSRSIHESATLQVSAYSKAVEEMTDLKIDNAGILQMGAQNKNGYRFEVYPREGWMKKYKVFEHVKETWQYENFGSKKNPKEAPVLELPESLKL